MSREARANLIFLTILLLVSLPGAIMLTSKRLSSEGRPTFPPAVRGQVAFMDRTPGTNPALPRFTPEETGIWLASLINPLTRTADLQGLLGPGNFRAEMSRELHYQLVGRDEADGDRRIAVVCWHPEAKDLKERFSFTATDLAGGRHVGSVRAITREAVPLNVKTELQRVGVVMAARIRAVIWIYVTFPGGEPAAALREVRIDYDDGEVRFSDVLALHSTEPAVTAPAMSASP